MQLFTNNINSIREAYPENHVRIVNEIEEPFWNSKVHRPEPLKFNDNDEICQLFIKSGSNLSYRIFANSESVQPQEFEKDDADHVNFVYAASCLMCDCYSIPRPEKFKVRYIAGKMSISIVTSTAIVAGMTCLNLYRLAMDATSSPQVDPNFYRNTSINTALNQFAVSAPITASSLPILELPAKLEWTVAQLVEALAEIQPYVLFYGSKPNTSKGEEHAMELWRHPDDGGALSKRIPPPHTPLGDALAALHKTWKLPHSYKPGKYLRLVCEKEDCDTITIKLLLG